MRSLQASVKVRETISRSHVPCYAELTMVRSQLQAKSVQPACLHLLRSLCHLRSTCHDSWQTLRPSSRSARPHVHIRISDFNRRGGQRLWGPLCPEILSWNGRIWILSAGNLLSDDILPQRRACSSTCAFLRCFQHCQRIRKYPVHCCSRNLLRVCYRGQCL